MTFPSSLKTALKSLLLMSTALFPLSIDPAYAQASPQASTPTDADVKMQFDIKRSNLDAAIVGFSRQIGRSVVYSDNVDGTRMIGPVKGTFRLEEALAQLLEGTGLSYRVTMESIVIFPTVTTKVSSTGTGQQLTQTDPVVVLAEETNRENIASSYVSSEVIDRMQATSVPELLDDLPGTDMNGTARPQGQSINIWGFADQEDIKITLDGAHKDFEKYRQGTIFIEPELVKRITVNKGSFSPQTYGAFGGSVELETKSASDMLRPGEHFGAFGKYGYATNGNENTQTGAVYGRDDDTGIELLVSGTRRDNRKFRTSDGLRLNLSSGTLHSGHFKGSIERDDHFLELSGAISESDRLAPYAAKRGQILPTAYLIGRYGYERALARLTVDRETADRSLGAKYRYNPFNDMVDLTAKLNWSRTEQHDERVDQDRNVSLSLGGNKSWLTYDTYQAELSNRSRFDVLGLQNTAAYGVQFSRQDRESWAFAKGYVGKPEYNNGYLQPYNIPEGRQDMSSVWGEYTVDFGNGLEVTPGLRYDFIRSVGVPNAGPKYNNPSQGHDYSEVTHQGFSPSLNLHYEVNRNYTVFADWAYKLRAPVIDEIYTVGSTTSTSQQLDVERVNAKRIGLVAQFNNVLQGRDAIKTRLSLYRNDVDKNIHTLFGSDNVALWDDPRPNYANLTGYYTKGLEAELYYDSGNVFGGASFSYMKGEHNGSLRNIHGADQPVYDVSPMKLVTTLGYKVAQHDIAFGWKGKFVGRQHDVPDDAVFPYSPYPATDGYALHDLFVSWEPDSGPFDGMKANFAVQNVFDRYHVPYLGVFPGKGRNIKFSLSKKF